MKIVIDGNIGAGKTTQLDILEKKGFRVRREPIDEWPLDLFYKDMSRWALTLQLAVMQTHQPVKTKDLVVYERSLLSCRYVFWEYLKAKDYVKAIEDVVHERAYRKYEWFPDIYIYLAIEPEEAFEHVKSRKGQAGDTGVTLEYMKEIDKLYRELLMKMPCQVHVVKAGGRTPEQIHEDISQILSFYTIDGVHVSENGQKIHGDVSRFLSRYVVDGVHVSDAGRKKVQKAGSDRRTMLCTPFTNMCRVS
jgi:deoxyadenosine/deoxycytidine kinase